MDSMMIHDMKNMEFRLNLLLSNLEEHYGDPDFKRSVIAHLNATLEKIESIVARWAAHQDSILIKVALDLNGLMRPIVEGLAGTPLRSRDESKRLRLTTNFGEIPRVWGDPYYLEEAFSSVFNNALEAASTSGSTVHVRTFEQKRKHRRVVVEISDDGAGMPQEFLRERLFRPFQTTKPNGVGLGLYTTKQILQLHHGNIDIYSEPGGGTKVRITLPAADQR